MQLIAESIIVEFLILKLIIRLFFKQTIEIGMQSALI